MATLLATGSTHTFAQTYPQPGKTIRLICGFPTGGGADLIFRLIAEKLKARTGQIVIVENKPGAAAHISTEFVMRAPPDGYTILMGTEAQVIGNIFAQNMKYDPLNDLVSVATVFKIPSILAVASRLNVSTVAQLTDYIRARKGEAKFPVYSTGATLNTTLYLRMNQLDAVRVNYTASQDTIRDMEGGLLDFGFFDTTTALKMVDMKTMVPLAVTTRERFERVPEIPTVIEAGVPDFEYASTWMVWMPKGTPRSTIKAAEAHFNAITDDQDMQDFIRKLPAIVSKGTAEDMDRLMKDLYAKWSSAADALRPQN